MRSKLAIASFVLSLISLLAFFILSSIDAFLLMLLSTATLGIFSMILGIVALVKISKNREVTGKTIAIIGVILGLLESLVFFIWY